MFLAIDIQDFSFYLEIYLGLLNLSAHYMGCGENVSKPHSETFQKPGGIKPSSVNLYTLKETERGFRTRLGKVIYCFKKFFNRHEQRGFGLSVT